MEGWRRAGGCNAVNDEDLTPWLTSQLASGAQIILLEAYANHVVIVVRRETILMLALKSSLPATDYVIGVGFKFVNEYSAMQPAVVNQTVDKPLEKGPKRFTFPIGDYHGPIQIVLTASKQHSRSFVVHV